MQFNPSRAGEAQTPKKASARHYTNTGLSAGMGRCPGTLKLRIHTALKQDSVPMEEYPGTLEPRVLIFWWSLWLLFTLAQSVPEARVKKFKLTALTEDVSKKLPKNFVFWFILIKRAV